MYTVVGKVTTKGHAYKSWNRKECLRTRFGRSLIELKRCSTGFRHVIARTKYYNLIKPRVYRKSKIARVEGETVCEKFDLDRTYPPFYTENLEHLVYKLNDDFDVEIVRIQNNIILLNCVVYTYISYWYITRMIL